MEDTGTWPESFLPDKIEFATNWNFILTSRMACAYVNQMTPSIRRYEKYKDNYEKIFYDIILIDGRHFDTCYPNAGTFHTIYGQQIEGKNVKFFRPSDKHPMDIEDDEGKNNV
jgi:hypothetical protein